MRSKNFAEWWNSIPEDAIFECIDCGRRDTKGYVQPQYRKDYALCVACITERNRRWREERKTQLAAMPRCVACKRRGTYRHKPSGTYLCGRHVKELESKILRKYGSFAIIAAMDGGFTLSREEIVGLLKK